MLIPRELGIAIDVVAAIILVNFLWTASIGAAFSPASQRVVRSMLELAGVGPDDLLYDLGSGDGRIVVAAASAFGATAVGIEADPVRVAWSRFVIRARKLRTKASVIRGNFFSEDISGATVVTLFLTQGTNQKLRQKFERELRPGTRVVSHTWTFDAWTPVRVEGRAKAYLYVIPPRADSDVDSKRQA